MLRSALRTLTVLPPRWPIVIGLLAGVSILLTATMLAERTQVAKAVSTCEDVLEQVWGPGTSVHLFRAEERTAGAVARWQEQRHAPQISGLVSPLRSRDASEPVMVCLYSGRFSTPHPPGLPDHNMLRLLVLADGGILFDSAGYQGVIDLESPSQ